MIEELVSPGQVEELRNKAEVLFEAGKTEEAIRCLLQAQSIEPADAGLMNDLGAIYAMSGEPELGRAYLERGLYINPFDSDAKKNLLSLDELPPAPAAEESRTSIQNAKNILFVAEYFIPEGGGAEFSAQAILGELVREGHHVSAVCQGDSFCEFTRNGITVRHVPSAAHISEAVSFREQDLVITQLNWAPEATMLAKRENKPVIFFLRSYEHFCSVPLDMARCVNERRLIGQNLQDEQRLKQHQEALGEVDRIICNSQFMNQVQSIFTNREGEVVYPSIEFEKVTALYHDPAFVTFGRPAVEKGLATFIEVAKQIPERHLISCGKNAYPLKELSPNIVDWGHGDIRIPLSKAKVLLVPSIWLEPFGRVVLEAMANGIPVIASRIGGIPEAGGEAALYIDDVSSPDHWVAAVKRVLGSSSLREEMREKGFARVEEFKNEDGLRKIKSIVKEVLGTTSQAPRQSSSGEWVQPPPLVDMQINTHNQHNGNGKRKEASSNFEGSIVYFQVEFPKLSETFVQAEIKEILKRHPNTYVVTCRPNYELLKDSPLRDRVVVAPSSPSGAFDAGAVARTISQLNPAYMHVHWLTEAYGVLFPIAKMLHVPFGFTCHAADLWRRGNRIEPEALEELAKDPLCITAATIGTHHIKHLLWSGFSEETVVITPNAVDREILPAPRVTPPTSTLNLISVGRPVWKKGFLVAIDAVRFLRLQGMDCTLTIVGGADSDSELGPMLSQYAEQFPFIRTTGMLPYSEVLEKIAQSDALLAPCMVAPDGDSDGIPTVLAEAMLMKVPVVTTDVASITDLVVPGETGFVARPGDPISFAEAVQELDRLLKDPPRARVFIEHAFSHAGRNGASSSAEKLLSQVTNGLKRHLPTALQSR